MQPINVAIQSTSIDLLQAIITRGEIDNLSLENIEAAVVGKLFLGIHMSRLGLQNKLLHLLHFLISASLSQQDSHLVRTNVTKQPQGHDFPDESQAQPGVHDSASGSYDVNPLLVQTLVDGIATQTNRPLLQHWLDFILMAVPQFQPAMQAVIAPLNDCLCRQLLLALADVRQASTEDVESAEDIFSTTTDSEMIMFLNSLERLILLSLTHDNQLEDDTSAPEKYSQENSGLLGYVSNVFGSDTVSNMPEDQLTVG
jgi:hypothetical protein